MSKQELEDNQIICPKTESRIVFIDGHCLATCAFDNTECKVMKGAIKKRESELASRINLDSPDKQ